MGRLKEDLSNLREMREMRGCTQEEVAKAVEVSPRAYQSWERGVGAPKPENKAKLMEYFNRE